MDTQRIIAFIIFSFSPLLLWESWQSYNNPQPAIEAKASKERVCLVTPRKSSRREVFAWCVFASKGQCKFGGIKPTFVD
jgi:hypothetical protein